MGKIKFRKSIYNSSIIIITGIMLFFVLIPNLAIAAEITGKAYGPNFEIMKDVILTVNTTPPQTYLSKDGGYSFELKNGKYQLNASYYSEGRLYYQDSQNIEIKEDGKFIIDFILLPSRPSGMDMEENS